MNLLIVYGTTDGMTARIAERMADAARAAGHEVRISNASSARGLEPAAFDAVMVGASLHAGGYQRSVRRWVRAHLDDLRRRPGAFFSVCMAIASRFPRDRDEAQRIAARFPAGFGWKPDALEVFAGALMFSRYGYLRRVVMAHIARREVGEIDTGRDHVYTDWEAVDRFTLGFLSLAARSRLPESATSTSP